MPVGAEARIGRLPIEPGPRGLDVLLQRRAMLEIFAAQNERERQWADVLTETEQQMLIMLLDKLIAGRERLF